MNLYRLTNEDKEKLLKESRNIIQKHSDRIPIIVRTRDKSIKLDKFKYLVPEDLSINQFLYVIRKRIYLNEKQGLFLLINDLVPPSTKTVGELFNEHMNTSIEMLVVDISRENTFG
jgi:GABA(A) receptor-associated protein